MNKLIAFTCLLFSTTVYGQTKPLTLQKLTAAMFDSAKMHNTYGIEEIGRIHFKYVKGSSLTHGQSGSNGYTWFSVMEKTGRLLITDSLKTAGITLKLNGIEDDIEFKANLYRNVNGKIKKIDFDDNYLQITEKSDTSLYIIDLKSAQTNDIVQLSYTITSKIIYTSRWLMVSDISPGTPSKLDIFTPSYLEYKVAFKGFKTDQVKNYSLGQIEQIITFERPRPFSPMKGTSELTSITTKASHGIYVLSSSSKLKYITATLVQETDVE